MREFLRPFLAFSFIALLLAGLVYSLTRGPTTEEIIKERLQAMGYPAVGLIIENQTIKYSDGRVIVYYPNWKVRAYYPITPEEALKNVNAQLDEVNEQLGDFSKKHGGKTTGLYLKADVKSLSELQKDGTLYWVFEVYLYKGGSNLGFAGFAYVDRQNGVVTWEGLLG